MSHVVVRIFFYNERGDIVYEFKHRSAESYLPVGSFDFRSLERLRVALFCECPRLLTLMRHASLEETSPVHCFRAGDRKILKFFVPQQILHSRTSREGLRFLLLKVLSENGCSFWLVMCEWNRQGFLLPGYILRESREPARLSFRQRKIAQFPPLRVLAR